MTSPTLLSLAGRVESERASQELNADIWLATRVGFSKRSFRHWQHMQPKDSNSTELDYARDRAPNFTGSLDSAFQLLSDGYYIIAIHQMPRGWIVKIGSRSNDQEPIIDVEHDSLVLALCSAWLRARSALEASHG